MQARRRAPSRRARRRATLGALADGDAHVLGARDATPRATPTPTPATRTFTVDTTRAGDDARAPAGAAVLVLVERGGRDVRVQARRGRVRGVHVAARPRRAGGRRRTRSRCARPTRPATSTSRRRRGRSRSTRPRRRRRSTDRRRRRRRAAFSFSSRGRARRSSASSTPARSRAARRRVTLGALAEGRTRSRSARPTRRATSTRRPRRGRSWSTRSAPADARSTAAQRPAPTFTFAADEAGATFECKLARTPGRSRRARRRARTAPLAEGALHVHRPRDRRRGQRRPGRAGPHALHRGARDRISSGPDRLTNDRRPVFELASSPPGATFMCTLDGAALEPCTGAARVAELAGRAATRSQVTATDDARQRRPDPGHADFTVDAHRRPRRSLDAGRVAGPLRAARLRASARATGRSRARSTTASTGRARRSSWPTTSRLGEHVFRARARTRPATSSDAGRVPLHGRQRRAGGDARRSTPTRAPRRTRCTPRDHRHRRRRRPPDLHARLRRRPDRERRAPRSPLIEHRYDAAGVYTVRLTVSDGRDTAVAERAITVTTAAGPDAAAARDAALAHPQRAGVDLGTFIPGLARDYTGSLTATTTGPAATLRVADPSATARGHLVGAAGALAQPLQVRATSGAFAPLTAP